MNEFEHVWVVVPAFNEASDNTIASTVLSLLSVFPNVVVVDDCSSDGTGELALAVGAVVCRHPVNLGQGAALATGIRFALLEGASEIVTFDADGQHAVEDAVAMVRRLRSGRVDVVLGSRFLGAAVGISARKRRWLQMATLYTRWTTGLKVTDTHNGLRVLGRSAAEQIRIRQNRMAHASEILHEIAAKRLSYVEMPTSITYTSYSVAKGQRMTGAFAILADLILRRLYQ
jgi:polyprenyl-phospho-N-acetylgalactosaminyl synthase